LTDGSATPIIESISVPAPSREQPADSGPLSAPCAIDCRGIPLAPDAVGRINAGAQHEHELDYCGRDRWDEWRLVVENSHHHLGNLAAVRQGLQQIFDVPSALADNRLFGIELLGAREGRKITCSVNARPHRV
jgi:hypothetical protein